jgi:hypothetical protein
MASQLDESVSIDAIVGAWTDTVRDALKPESASVWLRPGERIDRSHRA